MNSSDHAKSTQRAGVGETLEDAGQSMYLVTDERGNLMKVSQSTIFEVSNDNQFMVHQMRPTLQGNNSGALVTNAAAG